MKKQQTGRLGEDLACRALKKKGYHIIERNYRCRHGEIDVVASKDDCLIFIEVRSRTGNSFGTAAESVTAVKRQHLVATAMDYLGSHDNLPNNWRVDFVGINIDPSDTRSPSIEIIENALG